MKYNEIRLDSEGDFDDIAIEGIDSIHLEQMTVNSWWLGVYKGNKRVSFFLRADEEGVRCHLQDNQLKTKIVKYRK